MKKIIFIVWICCGLIAKAQQSQDEIIDDGSIVSQKSLSEGEAMALQRSASSGSSNEDGMDILLPKSSPFQLGKDVEGSIQNSINKTTGKVIFSVPITSVSANTVRYDISLSYNGQSAFDMAKNTNEFNPTGILGVGFNFSVPKIIADYKNTAAQDDDTFYLIDGNSTKLICTKKTRLYLEFKPEKYAPWKIKYVKGRIDFVNDPINPLGGFIERFIEEDYWEVIKEDGTIYQFGRSGHSKGDNFPKSYMSTWDNWIGDSKQTPSGKITTEWHLYRITDQWDNDITFSYQRVQGKQNSTQFQNFHTEAIYLKEIKSSDNSKVIFNYGNKIPQEYFEPHTEQTEPDAYQEKYEKKYLQNIQTFNSSNQRVYTYTFTYTLVNHTDATKPYHGKRYLTKVTQKNNREQALPSQEFQYHTTGDFAGGLKKVIYPTGGAVTYNYKKKSLFYNGSNRFSNSKPNLSGYYLKASLNGGDYILDLYRSSNPVSGNLYRYKIVRYHWTGQSWTINNFDLPTLLPYKSDIDLGGGSTRYVYLDRFKVVHGPDYYGFFTFDRSRNSGNIYMFHLNKDGKTWNKFSRYLSSIESKNEEPYLEDPVFMDGEDFVAIGTKRTGELRIFRWNGSTWNLKTINQNAGEYYYAARNNFILALNEDGNVDMVDGKRYYDNYYFHYLDIEKKWNTKSWSKVLKSEINGIVKASNFFPSNAMTAFVADSNPEYFLRWDKDYNIKHVDNVLGAHRDHLAVHPISKGFFSLDHMPRDYLRRIARFNGINWKTLDFGYYQGKRVSSIAYQEDFLLQNEYDRRNGSNKVSYTMYDANRGNWSTRFFLATNSGSSARYKSSLFGRFMLLDNKVYRKRENPFSIVTNSAFDYLFSVPFDVRYSSTNRLNYAYATSIDGFDHHNPNFINGDVKTRLYFTNKTNGRVSDINFDGKFGMKGLREFGGYKPFLNSNSIYLRNTGTFSGNTNSFYTYLYRVVDDKVNQSIYDIVVDNIEIDNQSDPVRKVAYQFAQQVLFPNETAFYGMTTIQHKGFGSDNNGRIVNFFNTGATDMRLLGLPIKTQIFDARNLLKSETTFTNALFLRALNNSSADLVDQAYFVRNTRKEERLIQSNGDLTTAEQYLYDVQTGLLKGKTLTYNNLDYVGATTTYANEIFPFLNKKNILNKPAKLIQTRNGKIIGVSETKWKEENYRVFPYQTLAGIENTKVLTEITRVNKLGLTEEETNGKGIYNVNLFGYNNKYPVAQIQNARFNDVISKLDVSYQTLQTLSTTALKKELLKLYTKLPNASITLSLYDANGNLISGIDTRQEEVTYVYDNFNRQTYVRDAEGNNLVQTEYNFKQ